MSILLEMLTCSGSSSSESSSAVGRGAEYNLIIRGGTGSSGTAEGETSGGHCDIAEVWHTLDTDTVHMVCQKLVGSDGGGGVVVEGLDGSAVLSEIFKLS